MIKQKQQDGNRGRSDSLSANEGLHSSILSLQTFTPGKLRECLQGSGNAKGYNRQALPKDLEEITPARETETLQRSWLQGGQGAPEKQPSGVLRLGWLF